MCANIVIKWVMCKKIFSHVTHFVCMIVPEECFLVVVFRRLLFLGVLGLVVFAVCYSRSSFSSKYSVVPSA